MCARKLEIFLEVGFDFFVKV